MHAERRERKAPSSPLHWEDVLSTGKTKIDCRLGDLEPTMHMEGLLPREPLSPGLPSSHMELLASDQSVPWTPANTWHMKTLDGPHSAHG